VPKKYKDIKVEEANLLPVMNIMFLLIPSLLLAMEVAAMAQITVSPPKYAANAAPTEEKPEDKKEKPLELKVHIMEEGFRVSAAKQQEGAEAGQEQKSDAPTIALAKPGAPMDDYERFNYTELEAKAREYKNKAPNEVVVTITAENTIPLGVLTRTMDALRGEDCRLMKAITANEEIPPECMFWQPVIEAGA